MEGDCDHGDDELGEEWEYRSCESRVGKVDEGGGAESEPRRARGGGHGREDQVAGVGL